MTLITPKADAAAAYLPRFNTCNVRMCVLCFETPLSAYILLIDSRVGSNIILYVCMEIVQTGIIRRHLHIITIIIRYTYYYYYIVYLCYTCVYNITI